MILFAIYSLAVTFTMLFLSVRLNDAQNEIRQMRESDGRRETAEYLAYRQGVMLSLACLLAGLAAASWYAPRSRNGAPTQ
jgi:hypothetical protein